MTWYDSFNSKHIHEVDNFRKQGFETKFQSELNCPLYRSTKYQDEPKP